MLIEGASDGGARKIDALKLEREYLRGYLAALEERKPMPRGFQEYRPKGHLIPSAEGNKQISDPTALILKTQMMGRRRRERRMGLPLSVDGKPLPLPWAVMHVGDASIWGGAVPAQGDAE